MLFADLVQFTSNGFLFSLSLCLLLSDELSEMSDFGLANSAKDRMTDCSVGKRLFISVKTWEAYEGINYLDMMRLQSKYHNNILPLSDGRGFVSHDCQTPITNNKIVTDETPELTKRSARGRALRQSKEWQPAILAAL